MKLQTKLLIGTSVILALFIIENAVIDKNYKQIISVAEYYEQMSIPALSILGKSSSNFERMEKELFEYIMNNNKAVKNKFYISNNKINSLMNEYDELAEIKDFQGNYLANEMMQKDMHGYSNEIRVILLEYRSITNKIFNIDSLNPSVDKHTTFLEQNKVLEDKFNDLITSATAMEVSGNQYHQDMVSIASQAYFFNLIVQVLVFTGMIGIIYFISFPIAKKFQMLRNATQKIAKGDYSIQITTKGTDELEDLAKSINFMAKSLKKANRDLYNFKMGMDEADIIAKTDIDGNITYANKKFCEISKYTIDELIGNNHRILKSGYHSPQFYEKLWRTISEGHIWRGDIKNKAKDGSYYWVKTVIVPIFDDNGAITEFLSVRTDITNRKNSEEKLQFAIIEIKEKEQIIKLQLEEIKKTDKQKDEFSSMVSHELKSPLGPILGYCELLRDYAPDKMDPIQSEAIDEIFDNAKRLERMIGDVLDVQKLNMNHLSFNKTKLELEQFLILLAKKYSPLMSEEQIQFKIKSNIKLTFQTDEDRLSQVFDNLILNAIDFVPKKNGKIEISIDKQDENLVFCVKDNGIGISKEEQQNLFKKFYQVDTSYTRSHGGTGLGLVICKSIVEGLGGKIWIESEKGKGATFFFTLPISQTKEMVGVIRN
ncbi:MAG: PAS domain S-box protein [Thaumarchaeota archaeon]|nr:PAS domain S-box protein [Nitrososphaerota archaeon]